MEALLFLYNLATFKTTKSLFNFFFKSGWAEALLFYFRSANSPTFKSTKINNNIKASKFNVTTSNPILNELPLLPYP